MLNSPNFQNLQVGEGLRQDDDKGYRNVLRLTEEWYGIKRENVVFCVFTVLLLYQVVGKHAKFVCALSAYVYPTYKSSGCLIFFLGGLFSLVSQDEAGQAAPVDKGAMPSEALKKCRLSLPGCS